MDSDVDAVVLANFFHEHAPYAIKRPERNIHVYSECISNGTMAEGVAAFFIFASFPEDAPTAKEEDSKPYDIPDFDREEDRRLYENDHLTLFYGSEPTVPACATHPDFKCGKLQIELYKKSLGLKQYSKKPIRTTGITGGPDSYQSLIMASSSAPSMPRAT